MTPRKRMQTAAVASAGAVVAALMTAGPAAAEPFTFVPCSTTALSAAIQAANTSHGGELLLSPGCTYTLTAADDSEDGLPQITAPISIMGLGDTITRSPSAPAFRIFDVAEGGDLTLSTLTVSGGGPTNDGGGIRNAGTLTLNATTVRGNVSGGEGGGIANSGTLNVHGSRVILNEAAGGGGIVNSGGGSVALSGSSVDGNDAHGDNARGGGILDYGGSVLGDLTSVMGNAATGDGAGGGGVATVGGSVTLHGGSVDNNRATVAPDGIVNDGGTVALRLTPVFANAPTNCAGSPGPVPGCFN